MEIYILLSEGKESCDVVCVSTDLMDIRLAIKQVLESPNYPTLQIWENENLAGRRRCSAQDCIRA